MALWRHTKGRIKAPKATNTGDQFVIIGPYGNVWHAGAFPTAKLAEDYLRSYWRGISGFDIDQWRVAIALVEVTALEPSWKFGAATPRDTDGSPKASPKVQSHD